MKISLRMKMTGWILLLVFFTTVILSVFASDITKKKFTEILDSNYNSNAYGYVAKIDGWLGEYASSTKAAAAMVMVSDDPANDPSVVKNLGILSDENPNYISAYCGFETAEYIDGGNWIPPEDWVCTTRPWYVDTLASNSEIVFSEPYVDAETGYMCITVSKKVNANGKLGVVNIDIYVDKVFENSADVVDARGNQGDYLFITTSSGDIIYHPNPDFMPTEDKVYNIADVIGGNYLKAMDSKKSFKDYNGVDSYMTVLESELSGWKVFSISPSTHYDSMVKGVRVKLMIAALICLVISCVAAIVISAILVKPIASLNKELGSITDTIQRGEGDLTKRINIRSKDELAELGGGINTFIESLQKIIGRIKASSATLQESKIKIEREIDQSNDSASNISAISEELAASMNLVSASSESIAASTNEVMERTETLVGDIEAGEKYVGEMKERAGDVRKLVSDKIASTTEMVAVKGGKLKEAIAESQKVDDISKLADDILNIASQTTLLALNASIEAARAGEQGKGFSVVASEIKNLAEESQTTANTIQDISRNVIDAVNNLRVNSDELIEAMNTMLSEDYQKFDEVGMEYYKDAEYVRDLLTSFMENSHKVQASMDVATKGVSEISTNIEECSKGINEVAHSTVSLVQIMGSIKNENDANSDDVTALLTETSAFKQV